MKQNEVFSNAVWLSAEDACDKRLVLRSRFDVHGVINAKIRVVGLGVFHCYINGKRVGEDLFMPLCTDFEERDNFPTDEVLSHRLYVPEYDIKNLLCEGENLLEIHFGGGWYTYDWKNHDPKYADAKVIWRIFGEDGQGEIEFCSSVNDEICESFVTDYYMTNREVQDYTHEAVFEKAVEVKALDTEYLFSSCPPDRVVTSIIPEKLLENEGALLYDIGRNASALPVVKTLGKRGERVRLRFFEEVCESGLPDEKYNHEQRFEIVCDGTERECTPLFTWFAFRYFTLEGNAEIVRVDEVHTDASVISELDSDNALINWINKAYINTQLSNMHSGIPSDCPHLERRGYTGDGQLTCHAAMTVLDAEAFYRKWIYDIYDCQDKVTGHVQYTAPYTFSGGGPGGWGCAIIEVPYRFWKHYGDTRVLVDGYDKMLRYFDYLEEHSDMGLVTSDKEGKWCLGDWCAQEAIVIPAPFVNTYFYVRSLDRMIEIAKCIGRDADIPLFEKRRCERTAAMTRAYYNDWDGNFLGCVQGANAFAVDIGIGDERTYKNLVKYYQKLGRFDTGIFATDLVAKVLFERGDAQLAFDLITSRSHTSFNAMMEKGATTLWEYWPHSFDDRSHNHPMFGAVTAYFYDYFLGIQQKNGTVGYRELVIAPVTVDGISSLSGVAHGTKVSYVKREGSVEFEIDLPEWVTAEFVFAQDRISLNAGMNKIVVSI